MKKMILAMALLVGLTQSGCAFLGGAAVGSLATGAGYELNNHSQMEKLEAAANKWFKPYPNPGWRENFEVLLVALASRRPCQHEQPGL